MSNCRSLVTHRLQKRPSPPHHNRFRPFLDPPEWAGAIRELLDFMLQGKIIRARHTDHLPGRYSIRTKQCPPLPCSHFTGWMPFPAVEPTVSKHLRQWCHQWQNVNCVCKRFVTTSFFFGHSVSIFRCVYGKYFFSPVNKMMLTLLGEYFGAIVLND